MDPSDSSLARAVEAHRAGRFVEAESAYRTVLREHPRDGDALNFLGMLRFHRGDAAGALELLREAVRALPDNPHAWVHLGNVLLATDDIAGAKSAYVRATELAPGLAVAWYDLGMCLRRCDAPLEAASCLEKALKLEPGYGPAYGALGLLLYKLGELAQAAEVYRAWLACAPHDPIPRHMLAAMTGEDAPPRAADAYVTAIFENCADRFDKDLRELDYVAPQLLAERVGSLIGTAGRVDILDAGCGTGSSAPLLRPMARRLTGVDLSPAMIEKARIRGGYDELVVGELSAFMRSRARSFDVVLSADTLCYFGALEEPLAAASACLRPGGVLAFTVERLEPETQAYRIHPHGRYSHAGHYVAEVLADAGFVDAAVDQSVLRREGGENVHGLIVTAKARWEVS